MSIKPDLFTKDKFFFLIFCHFSESWVNLSSSTVHDSFAKVALQHQGYSFTSVGSSLNYSIIAELNIINYPLLCLGSVFAIMACQLYSSMSTLCVSTRKAHARSNKWSLFAPAFRQILTLVVPQTSLSRQFWRRCCLYRGLVELE